MLRFVFLCLLFFIFSFEVWKAKGLSAHDHGRVSLDIAVEANQALVMLKGPAEAFLGFEHKPKTKAEKKLVESFQRQWNSSLYQLFGGEQMKNCQQEKVKWNHDFEGTHSEIRAESYFTCKEPLKNKVIDVSLKEYFKRIKFVSVQIIRADGSVMKKKFKNINFKLRL